MSDCYDCSASVRQTRRGRWIAQVCVCGQKIVRMTDATDREEAETICDAMLANECRRVAAELGAIPFMRFWSKYASSPMADRLSRKQFACHRSAWIDFARWINSAHPEITGLEGVTRRTGEEFLDALTKNYANATCNNRVSHLREIFGCLLWDAGVRFNPWDVVKALPHNCERRRELTADEIGRLIETAKTKGREWVLLFRIAAYKGMRLGECCNLEWKNIDMERDVIQIVQRKTRGRVGDRPVTIPLHRVLKKHLLCIPCTMRYGLLMPELAHHYKSNPKFLHKSLNRIFDESGIDRVEHVTGRIRKVCRATFHSIRHSFVSFTANAGAPLEVVRAIVGHENSGITRHYYHADEKLLRKAVDAIPAYDIDGNCIALNTAAPARKSEEQDQILKLAGTWVDSSPRSVSARQRKRKDKEYDMFWRRG